MKYHVLKNEDGDIKLVGCGPCVPDTHDEVSAEEYEILRSETQQKSELAYALYTGQITADDVPTEWQVEVQRRVDELIEQAGSYVEEATPEERIAELEAQVAQLEADLAQADELAIELYEMIGG